MNPIIQFPAIKLPIQISIEQVKTIAILILFTLLLIAFFGTKRQITVNNSGFENLISRPNEKPSESMTLSEKLNLYISSLGVFSTVLLVIIGFTVINSFNQQKQFDEYLENIKTKSVQVTQLLEQTRTAAESTSRTTKFDTFNFIKTKQNEPLTSALIFKK